jgi:predicted nuclease of predicted toxin-antitoxin system
MRVLFDQNLSPWLCPAIRDVFPDAVHVREVGLRDASDATIWDYAARNGFAIVTKDADFRHRSFLHGHPPKVIWVRLGNCSTTEIERLLRKRRSEIEDFLVDDQKSFFGLS